MITIPRMSKRIWLFIAIGFIVLSLTFAFQIQSSTYEHKVIGLLAPDFVKQAHAQGSSDIVALLDAEAGISAYVKSSSAINLNQVASVYRTIETQTATYIIGSVPVTGYPEHFDAHVYTSSDGWILAYYMNDEPGSKMMDAQNRSITNTNLRTAVAAVAGPAGVPIANLAYYDFRFPNATNILLIYEDGINGIDFRITLPSTFAYMEMGFFEHSSCGDGITVDGITVPWFYRYTSDWYYDYGTIPASLLTPDIVHVVNIAGGSCTSNYDGMVMITYRVP